MKPFLTCLLALCLNAVAVAQSPVTIDLFPFGPVADSLYLHGYYRKAIPFAEEAVAVFRRQSPGDGVNLAKALFRLGNLHLLSGFHEKSETLNREAYDLYYGLRGMEDDTCAMIFGALVESLIRTQKWEEAESLIAQALSETSAQTTLSEYGKTLLLIAQGRMHHQRRRYKEALNCYQPALQALERMGKRYGQEYPWLLYYAGAAEESSGRYEEARSYMRQCFETWEALLGKGHTATVIPNLAVRTLENDNDLFSVRDQYLEALGILEEKLGADAWVCGIFHYNLTGVYFDLGNYDQAEYHLNLALDGSEKRMGRLHSEYPMLLASLGKIMEQKGEWDKAEACYRESRTLREQILTRKHPHYSESTSWLAALLLKKGEPEEALRLLKEALSIQVEIDGQIHIGTYPILQQMAFCHALEGDFPRADSLLGVAEEIILQVFGPFGKELATNKEYRVMIEILRGAGPERVSAWLREAQTMRQSVIRLSLPRASGRELEALVGAFYPHYEISCFAAERYGLSEIAYDNALFFKNLALNTQAAMRSQITRSGEAESRERFEQWASLQAALAAEWSKPLAFRESTDSLQQALYVVERDLSALMGDAFEKQLYTGSWQDVRAALKPGEAAIEFVQYRPAGLEAQQENRYAAMVLRPGDMGPHFITLCEEKKLVALLELVGQNPTAISALYERGGRVHDSRPVYGEELYNLIWKPIAPLLRNIKTVYYAPDGLLHRIAFDALPVGGGVRKPAAVLAGSYHLRRLSSTRTIGMKRDLVVCSTAAIFGGATFDAQTEPHHPADTIWSGDSGAQLWAMADRPRGYYEEGFSYLPGTETEAQLLHRLFSTRGIANRLYTKERASEEAINALGAIGGKAPAFCM
ncbi:MAG: tetratricopeptide repeat protein [Saprospirales bacterium]|nr:tetratricopeptide repeat protein [Saprospirales bacterium]